jgi:hypothetical protein
MKLRARFLQLPIRFDAERLAEEVGALPNSAWRAHPKKFPGNDALPLITADGDPDSDARGGSMRPTAHLLACPYMAEVLASLGATWGRSRLMRLTGDAEVTPHVDTDYYWRDRMRVHVPIVTQPTVKFHCGGETVNMAAGECWIFDTWSLHSVHNDAVRSRIHLVADTVGGDGLLSLIEKGRSSRDPAFGHLPESPPAQGGAPPALACESYNLPTVMTPWELRDHLGFLMSEAAPGDARIGPIGQALNRLRVNWHALWAQYADDEAAWPAYASLLAASWAHVTRLGVYEVLLRNQMPLGLCLKTLIFDAAVKNGGRGAMDADERLKPQASPATISPPVSRIEPAAAVGGGATAPAHGRDASFDRPVFIVSSPRSGSSVLFETLSGARDVFTIGGESHGLIEAIPDLGPAARGWESNRLTEADATPVLAARLRDRFAAALRDRNGRKPSGQAVRMLEKTPKNALRIPFLASVFPEARFIYLHRDPRPTLASMIEAWTSGQFRTYPQLPGWAGPPWSLLLTPQWRDLHGKALNEIVAHQWVAVTQTLLDDLMTLGRDRWSAVSYEEFIAAPQTTAAALCAELDLHWDCPVGSKLPLASNTLSEPSGDKWRRHAPDLDAVAPLFEAQSERALGFLKRGPDTRAHRSLRS